MAAPKSEQSDEAPFHALVCCDDDECSVCHPAKHHVYTAAEWLRDEARRHREHAVIWPLASAEGRALAPIVERAADDLEALAARMRRELEALA